jgi:phosphatidylglycerophosphatase A
MRTLALSIATVAGTGLFPIAPGTAGSLAGLAVLAVLRATGQRGLELPSILVLFVVGAWAAGLAEQHYGRRDPGAVVVDEVLGMMITLALLPVGWYGALFGFLAFRVFDIVKPWPARSLESLPGGWGVMADDGMAGVYAHLLTRFACWVAPSWMLAS